MVLRVVLGPLREIQLSRFKAVVRGVDVEAAPAAEMVVEVVAADAGAEVMVAAMQAVETEAGEAHAITHFWYSTGPGAT